MNTIKIEAKKIGEEYRFWIRKITRKRNLPQIIVEEKHLRGYLKAFIEICQTDPEHKEDIYLFKDGEGNVLMEFTYREMVKILREYKRFFSLKNHTELEKFWMETHITIDIGRELEEQESRNKRLRKR